MAYTRGTERERGAENARAGADIGGRFRSSMTGMTDAGSRTGADARGPAAPPPGVGARRRAPGPGRRRACRCGLLPVLAVLFGALALPAAARTPATPTDFKVSAGNAAFFVEWGAVTGANSYLIEWDANASTGFAKTAAATPGAAKRKTIAHSATDPVVNGTLYKVRVRACSNANPVGAVNLDCSASTATLTVTPGSPGELRSWSIGWGDVTNELGKTIRVEWEPGAANGSPITGYDVHYTTSWTHSRDAAATATYFEGSLRLPDPATGWVEILRQNRRSTTQFIYGGSYGTYYRVRMRAVNAIGTAEWEETGYIERVSTPDIVPNVQVAPGNGKLTLTWEAPSRWGSWPPGGYEVQWKLASAARTEWTAVWTSGAPAVIGPDATRFEFTGRQQGSATVTNGTAYDLRIRAWNKRPGTDGSAADDRRATRVWHPAKVSGTPAGASKAPTPTVSLSAAPNPVAEGSEVRVTATLSSTLAYEATIPLSLTHAHGTAEDGDYGALASITIPAGASSATGTITTSRDADADDETFTVALDTANLPSYVDTGDASSTAVTITITDDGTQQQQQQQQQRRAAQPLTAAFEGAPETHDGKAAFSLDLRFSDALGTDGRAPAVSSFKVAGGKAKRVERVEAGLWRVRVKPGAWRAVTVTLAPSSDCAAAGAVCASGGRALTSPATATVGGPVRIRVADARAKEGKDETLDFAVTLSRAAAQPVSVDYATANGTATAGADYTAASGTLVFAPGETEKTVAVAILDDAIDEGKETFKLRLSNPRGAFLRGIHREAKGVIKNDDPLPQAYLGYFGARAASDAIAAVTARFETPRGAGSHLTFAGQRLDFSGGALADTMTGLARAFGAEEAAPGGDAWHDPASAPGRAMDARELLMGTSFRAVLGHGTGSQLTSWGQGATVSHFSGATPGLSLSGEAATGALGMDYERGRLLAGFALTHSLGAGTAHGAGETYALGSSVTTVLPYARFALTERISAWTLAGTGSGGLTLDDDDAAQRHRTDLSMTLAAAGMRGDLVTPVEAGGFALALKADAFWVRTESDAVRTAGAGRLASARADATRVRALLDGSRAFALAGGRTLAPSLALGLRHDGGDAGTGTGMELGAGLGFTDPSRGLDMALKVYGLAAHAEDRHREWGVSGSLKLAPGATGRGLSMALTPSYGVAPGGSERLWTMPDAHAVAANGEAATASSRLDTELGYGVAMFGGGFTATPNVGFGLSDGGLRDYRLGWRLTPAAANETGVEVSLDAMRRETGDDADHSLMLRGAMRW